MIGPNDYKKIKKHIRKIVDEIDKALISDASNPLFEHVEIYIPHTFSEYSETFTESIFKEVANWYLVAGWDGVYYKILDNFYGQKQHGVCFAFLTKGNIDNWKKEGFSKIENINICDN